MNRKLLVSLVLAIPLLWTSGTQAALLAEYSINGGSSFVPICSDPTGAFCFGVALTSTGISVIELASSNSPGTSTLAQLLSTTFSITNTASVARSIELRIGSTGFLAPTAPPGLTLASNVAGNVVIPGAGNTLSFISCIDQGNGQNTCPGTLSTGALTPAITTVSAYAAGNSALVSLLSPGFSITQDLLLTLAAGSSITINPATLLVPLAPVPEPITMFLGGTGLLALGYAARRRLFGR